MSTKPNELYHYGVLGMKWGHHIYAGYQDEAVYRKTSRGRAKAADTAANLNARNVRKQSIKDAKGLREKAHNAYGYTGAAKMHEARSNSYNETAKRLSESGRIKEAIRAKAVANNNKSSSNWDNKVLTAKNAVQRAVIANTRLRSDTQKYYSKAGREYTLRSENLKNTMTMGAYGLVKDAQYKRKYTAEERLSRLGG